MEREHTYICTGCQEKCKMTSSYKLTGCVYEDGEYSRDADIRVVEQEEED